MIERQTEKIKESRLQPYVLWIVKSVESDTNRVPGRSDLDFELDVTDPFGIDTLLICYASRRETLFDSKSPRGRGLHPRALAVSVNGLVVNHKWDVILLYRQVNKFISFYVIQFL